jgi:hypothetical protein
MLWVSEECADPGPQGRGTGGTRAPARVKKGYRDQGRLPLFANQLEAAHTPEFAQFGSSPNCSLQFANCGHGVAARRSMCRKVAG